MISEILQKLFKGQGFQARRKTIFLLDPLKFMGASAGQRMNQMQTNWF